MEQKVKKLKEQYQFPDEYDDDLKKVFSGQLSIVRALEVVTRYQENKRRYVQIYEQLSEMDHEVQMSLARLFAYIDKKIRESEMPGVTYEQWNCGAATKIGMERLQRYKKEHHITGIDVVYQKVVPVWEISGNGEYEMTVEGAEGSSFCINRLTGLVVE